MRVSSRPSSHFSLCANSLQANPRLYDWIEPKRTLTALIKYTLYVESSFTVFPRLKKLTSLYTYHVFYILSINIDKLFYFHIDFIITRDKLYYIKWATVSELIELFICCRTFWFPSLLWMVLQLATLCRFFSCNYFLNINIPEARSLTQNSSCVIVLETHFHIVLSLCYTTCRHRNLMKYFFYVNKTRVFIIVPQNTMWVENLDTFTYFCYRKWWAYFIFLEDRIYLLRIWAIFSFCLSWF